MQLFIPSIGQKLMLTADWRFNLRQERRNHAMLQAVRGEDPCSYYDIRLTSSRDYDFEGKIVGNTTLPVGTVLAVDRVYIRKGLADWNSITFVIEDCPDPRFRSKKMKGTYKGKPRFWVRLTEANTIQFDFVSEVAA